MTILFKALHSTLSSLGMVLIKSPGDGHCLIHSIKTSWCQQFPNLRPIDCESIKSKIFVETITHANHYANFLEPVSKFEVLQSLKFYLLSRKYCNRFGDCLPLIVANALQVNIELYDENPACGTFTKFLISPNFSSAVSTVLLHRCGDHFNGIAPFLIPHIAVSKRFATLRGSSDVLKPSDVWEA